MNYFKYKGRERNQNPLPWITLTEIELKKILESDGNITFNGFVVDENVEEKPIQKNIVVYQQPLMPDAETIYIPHRIFKETSLVALQRKAHAGKEYGICLEDEDPNKEEVYRHLMPTWVNDYWSRCHLTKVKERAAIWRPRLILWTLASFLRVFLYLFFFPFASFSLWYIHFV